MEPLYNKRKMCRITTDYDKIRSAVKTKYADYTAGNQIEKLILADTTVQYLVDLSKGGVAKEVIVSADGNVVLRKVSIIKFKMEIKEAAYSIAASFIL